MKLREPMPELEGATVWFNTNPIQRDDLIGKKPTLLHFWSVSCTLCKQEMPIVNQFRDEYENSLNVIAIHMPRSKKDMELNQIKWVANEQHIHQPIFVDNDRKLTEVFDNKYVPAYYLFDDKGKLRHYQAGSGSMKMLRYRVNRVLGKTELK